MRAIPIPRSKKPLSSLDNTFDHFRVHPKRRDRAVVRAEFRLKFSGPQAMLRIVDIGAILAPLNSFCKLSGKPVRDIAHLCSHHCPCPRTHD